MALRGGRRKQDDGVRFPLPLFVFCLLVSAALLWLDRPADRIAPLVSVRAGFNDAMSPALQLARRPLDGLANVGPWWRRQGELAQENRALRLQIAELRAWRDVALSLQERNARYAELVNLQAPRIGERISAWTVADQSSDFVQSRLIAAGRAQGVRTGYPAVNLYGLVGRTVEVGERTSRVLLLTDFNSRIAVMADRSNDRALLVGDNTDFPRLEYLSRDIELVEGDRIVTSGDDNVMPRGLPVGEAVLDRDGRWRVVLYSRAAPIDLISVWPYQPTPEPASMLDAEPAAPGDALRPAPDTAPPAADPAPALAAPIDAGGR